MPAIKRLLTGDQHGRVSEYLRELELAGFVARDYTWNLTNGTTSTELVPPQGQLPAVLFEIRPEEPWQDQPRRLCAQISDLIAGVARNHRTATREPGAEQRPAAAACAVAG